MWTYVPRCVNNLCVDLRQHHNASSRELASLPNTQKGSTGIGDQRSVRCPRQCRMRDRLEQRYGLVIGVNMRIVVFEPD